MHVQQATYANELHVNVQQFEPPCVNCVFRQNHQEGLVPQLMPRSQKTNKLVSTGRKFHTSKMLTRN